LEIKNCSNLKYFADVGLVWNGFLKLNPKLKTLHIENCDQLCSVQIEATGLDLIQVLNNKSLKKITLLADFKTAVHFIGSQCPLIIEGLGELYAQFPDSKALEKCIEDIVKTQVIPKVGKTVAMFAYELLKTINETDSFGPVLDWNSFELDTTDYHSYKWRVNNKNKKPATPFEVGQGYLDQALPALPYSVIDKKNFMILSLIKNSKIQNICLQWVYAHFSEIFEAIPQSNLVKMRLIDCSITNNDLMALACIAMQTNLLEVDFGSMKVEKVLFSKLQTLKNKSGHAIAIQNLHIADVGILMSAWSHLAREAM